jgi:hypothetical protein
MDNLLWVFERVAADHSYFAKAFTPGRPPQPAPRVLVG